MSSAGSQLTALPDEVVQAILGYLPAPTTVALQQTCRRFVHVANEPLLWRSYCQREWRWWDRRRHAFLTAGPSDVGVVDWKALYADRHTSAKATRTAVSHIVADDVGRLDRVASILDSGYDVKDTLLDLFVNAAASESHLAQKYWAHAALGCLHRFTAVEEWLAIKNGADPDNLERPIAALDLFILEERPEGDIDDIFARLDSYVASVRDAHPDIDHFSPRQKATAVAEHLLTKKWIGIQGDRHYHSLDHMFLGVALFSENRNSVPLISAVIFCYVVRQFGLRAAPCNYPFHVHALVQPPPGMDLDGNAVETDDDDDDGNQPTKETHLYMDPFNNAESVSLSVLETQLNFIAPHSSAAQRASYLSAAGPRDLLMRTAHNVLSSPSHYAGAPAHPINANLATYAALFSLVLLPSSSGSSATTQHHPHPVAQMRQHLAVLTQHFFEFFDLDLHLFERHVLPLATALPNDARAYRDLIRRLHEADHQSRPAKYRLSDPRNAGLKYKVGQVFRHRRRSYIAVIYGWDPYCRMQEQWITNNEVDRLPHGRHQPFYNVLVEDQSTRYVAEENVVLLEPGGIPGDEVVDIFPIEIGKWFKSYDEQTATFVSNVRHEYPED